MGIEEFLLDSAKKEGIKEGIEKGREEGIEKGIEKGREEGIKKTAAKMKQSGLDIQLISQITGLSEEEINTI